MPGDVINQFAGIAPGSPLAQLREQRPETLRHAQGSFQVLLEPDDPGGVSREEREAIALRVETLERFPDVADFTGIDCDSSVPETTVLPRSSSFQTVATFPRGWRRSFVTPTC